LFFLNKCAQLVHAFAVGWSHRAWDDPERVEVDQGDVVVPARTYLNGGRRVVRISYQNPVRRLAWLSVASFVQF
jgi:hypothetical protein